MACPQDTITGLSVCTIDQVVTARLHGLLRDVSAYLYEHHRASDFTAYRYRTAYLPEYVTGNDVAAVSRAAQEALARGLALDPILSPLVPGTKHEAVTSGDVDYLAQNAPEVTRALTAVYDAIKTADATGVKTNMWHLFAYGVAGIVGLVVIVELARRP